MFRRLLLSSLFCSTLLLTACASIISTLNGNDSIQENQGSRTTGSVIDDGSIETMIKVNLNAADDALRESNIDVVSFNQTVLLVGQVPDQELKNLATRVATTSNSRVKTVYNELEVAGDTSFLSRTNDVWLSTKIKSLMLVSDDVEGLRTKVVTENGVVYLMGLLTHSEADRAVDLVSTTSGVTKVVRAFEYID
ncbi:BON domain-containing protein [Haliea sp. AH-315-K21]|uniref:Phospholipid-binding protein n=1 Tax=SAR86 cluster bacterium TaxID=2030880 RepID=A0A2A5C9S6_9GAMM|nr:BON domain-containing protein [Haliea sp. AH-315-K21]PCJ40644.1 MAG: phospholipid-binding protein [SAR86 cluster bacterium]